MLAPYRSRLLASTLLVGAVMAANPAFAQAATPASQPATGAQSTEAAAPEAENTGDIVVTGSLISNPNLIASSPVSVIGQDEIALRQSSNAEQLIRDLPGVVPSIGANVNNGNGGASFRRARSAASI